MSVRILEGTYDGTDPAAVMIDSTSGCPFGPLWRGPEAVEQIEEFQNWLRREPWLRGETFTELDLRRDDLPGPLARAHDPRAWPATGLDRLVSYWREKFLVDGRLPTEQECFDVKTGATDGD